MSKGSRIEYNGFLLEGTGGFFSGDGYRALSVPAWVPKRRHRYFMRMHLQDTVWFRSIDDLWKHTKATRPDLTAGVVYRESPKVHIKIEKMPDEKFHRIIQEYIGKR